MLSNMPSCKPVRTHFFVPVLNIDACAAVRLACDRKWIREGYDNASFITLEATIACIRWRQSHALDIQYPMHCDMDTEDSRPEASQHSSDSSSVIAENALEYSMEGPHVCSTACARQRHFDQRQPSTTQACVNGFFKAENEVVQPSLINQAASFPVDKQSFRPATRASAPPATVNTAANTALNSTENVDEPVNASVNRTADAQLFLNPSSFQNRPSQIIQATAAALSQARSQRLSSTGVKYSARSLTQLNSILQASHGQLVSDAMMHAASLYSAGGELKKLC